MNRSGGKRFEPNAVLAWRLDLDGGYRDASHTHWHFVPFAELPPQRPSFLQKRGPSVRVDLLAGKEGLLPETFVEPVDEGQVRVRGQSRLTVQEYGDKLPSQADPVAEVTYGSVVRAGPLLFAPLYAEQARAIEMGQMTLPLVGGDDTIREDDLHRFEHEQQEAREAISKARPSRWPLYVVALVLLSIGALWLSAAMRAEPAPHRVLIGLCGVPVPMHKDVLSKVSKVFSRAGFSPIPGHALCSGDNEHGLLDKAGYAFIVSFSTVVHRQSLDPSQDLMSLTVEGQLSRAHAMSVGTSVTLTGVAATEAQIAQRLGPTGVDAVVSDAMARLASQPIPASFGRGLDGERRRKALERREHASTVAYVTQFALDNYRRAEWDARAAFRRANEPDFSIPLEQPVTAATPVGVAPDGSFVVTQVSTQTPSFPFSETSEPMFFPQREEIRRINTKGRLGTVRALDIAERYVGQAQLSEQGEHIVAVEQSAGRQGLIRVFVKSTGRQVVHVVDSPHRIVDPRISPDGRWIVAWIESPQARRLRLFDTATGYSHDLGPGITGAAWVRLRLADRREGSLSQSHRADIHTVLTLTKTSTSIPADNNGAGAARRIHFVDLEMSLGLHVEDLMESRAPLAIDDTTHVLGAWQGDLVLQKTRQGRCSFVQRMTLGSDDLESWFCPQSLHGASVVGSGYVVGATSTGLVAIDLSWTRRGSISAASDDSPIEMTLSMPVGAVVGSADTGQLLVSLRSTSDQHAFWGLAMVDVESAQGTEDLLPQ